MLDLIINADDLGLTSGCNEGIIKAITKGIVTDTTLMVNTDFTQDAIGKLKQHGITRVGLHLNLTFGEPVLAAGQVPSLVDAQGRFRRKAAETVPLMKSIDVKRELSAQVAKFLATGLGLTHLDSHHHAHTYPAILDIVIDLAQQLHVPLRQGNETVRQTIKKAGIAATDAISLNFYEQGATLDNLKQIIQSHPCGTLEIMCHPANPDQLLYDISSYNHWRENELAVLTSQEIQDFIKNNGVRLVGFDALQV
ncbi:MAG: YdjC family protein [Firmicutes bacterium]|nr:YdjC family protein [Bacillota bacterium]